MDCTDEVLYTLTTTFTLLKCTCGEPVEQVISTDRLSPTEMMCCGKIFYVKQNNELRGVPAV